MKLDQTVGRLRQKLARIHLRPVSTGSLKNGMRFYSLFDKQVHVAGVGVRVGSIHDPIGLRGMAHLMEHMKSREAKGYSLREIDLTSRAYGAGPRQSINITTWVNATAYLTDLLMDRKSALHMFDIFSGMVQFREFTERALDSEKAVVFDEYSYHGEDDMECTIDRLLHEAMYEKNPVRNRTDCEPEELKRITIKNLEQFDNDYYGPNNMFAVVLGPRVEEARLLVEEKFGHLKPRRTPALTYDFSETRPELSGIKSIEVDRKGIREWHVGIAFPTDPWGTKGEEAIDVLAEILSFRVEQMLRDQNRKWGEGTYHPFAYAIRSSLHGMLYVWFETQSESFAREAEERIIRECERIKQGGVLPEEIQDIGRRIEKSDERRRTIIRLRRRRRKEFREEWLAMQTLHYVEYVSAYYNTFGVLANLIVDAATNAPDDVWEAHQEMRWLNEYRTFLRAVKPRQVIQAANEYFTTPDRYVRVVLRPIDPNTPIVAAPRIIMPGESREWKFKSIPP